MISKAMLTIPLLLATALPASAQTADYPKTTTLPAAVVEPNGGARLPPEDVIAIHEVLARVYLAEDSRDYGALRQLVTPDLVHEHSIYGTANGPEGLVSLVRDHPERFDGLRHQALNIATRALGPTTAEAVSYIVVLQLHAADETDLPRILAHGVVRDQLAKQGGVWRIAHRTYEQFALSAAVVPDPDVRGQAARVLSTDP